jgi:hypothetical protein
VCSRTAISQNDIAYGRRGFFADHIFLLNYEITVTDFPNRSTTFQLEPDDYVAANRLHTRMIWRRPRSLASFAFLIPAYAGFLYLSWHAQPDTGLAIFISFVVICAIAFPPLSYLLYLPYKTRKVFHEQKNLHYPMTMSWSDAGFKVENQQGSAVTPWQDFFKWGEDSRILLLYHSSRLFYMLPRRVLTEAQLTDLRQFIKVPRM